MFSVECRLSNLQEQNNFQASQPSVACCSASCEYVNLISIATFSFFRTREFNGKPWWSWLFFFFFQALGAQSEDEILTLLHQSNWIKSCCVLVLLLIVVYFRSGYEVWRIRQRIPHFLCGFSLLFRVSQMSSTKRASTISNQQHLLQKKLIQVKKNDFTVTVYLSVLEALWQWYPY